MAKNSLEPEEKSILQDILTDHCAHPRHMEKLPPPARHFYKENRLCGDEIDLYLIVKKEKIKRAAFQGHDSTPLCLASASLMCDALMGLTIKEAQALSNQALESLKKGFSPTFTDASPVITPLLLVHESPRRLANVRLPWLLLKESLTAATAEAH